jgi:hypothetical protein
MNSARKPPPRFHVGDWVSVLYGARKVLARVTEDRGPIGIHGRRLYRIRLDREQGEPTDFELPEGEIEAAPESRGIPPSAVSSTHDRLSQAFQVEYVRQGSSNTWTAETNQISGLEGVKAMGAFAYSPSGGESEAGGYEYFAVVTVLLDRDPRLDHPFTVAHEVVRSEMADKARKEADKLFKEYHPEAIVKHIRI